MSSPRFDTSKLLSDSPFKGLVPSNDTNSGRMEKVLSDFMSRTQDITFVLDMIKQCVSDDIDAQVDRGLRLLIFTQYITAKENGIHITRHISMCNKIGMSHTEWYLWILNLYNADSIKLDEKTDLISWRISELNLPGIKGFEEKVATDQHRAPVDFFSPSYVRRAKLGNPNPAKQDIYDKLMTNIHRDYIELYTYGTPASKPEEFFI